MTPVTKKQSTKKPAKQSKSKKTEQAEVLNRPEPTSELTGSAPIDPVKIHELLGLHGPYEPPPPVPTKGYTIFWDPGCSIQTLAKKQTKLFCRPDLLTERFTKDTDSWKWRMIRLQPIEPNLSFADQEKQLSTGDNPAAARELVTFLVLHFLATGVRLEMDRWRCRDVIESGRRVIVGPFWESGIEIANVSDLWNSPGICLSVLRTPQVRKK